MELEKFLQQEFRHREFTLDVPELAPWFGKKPPQWTLRTLTAAEIGRVRAAVAEIVKDRVEAMVLAASGDGGVLENAKELLEFYGKEVPTETSRRIELLVAASVNPDLTGNRMVAVKLSEAFPALFAKLTDKVAELYEQGQEPGKPQASGETQQSGG